MKTYGKNKNKYSKSLIAAILSMTIAVGYCFGLFTVAFRTEHGAAIIEGLASEVHMDYEDRLFDTTCVHRLEISIQDGQWERLKSTALKKELFDCDLSVDGETLHHVGVRTKGNSTLLQSVIGGGDKIGLAFEFDAFQEGQTYYGLDFLSLYNHSCDSSCLRNMLSFALMREMGVPAPLCSFAEVYLNGNYLGLYTVMEGVKESFAIRNFGIEHGMLYKPEPSDVAGLLTGTAVDVQIDVGEFFSEGGNPFGSFEKVLAVSALQYFGDDPTEYEVIWANSVFKIDNADKQRLIAALRDLSDDQSKGSVVMLQEVAAYSAVNTFLINTDCYATNMGHNYYLYEKDGILCMIPWDYDQCLGISMLKNNMDADLTALFNLAIDTPVIQTTVEERPMLSCVLNDENGYILYRAALERLATDYLESGWVYQKIDEWAALLTESVAREPLMSDFSKRNMESVQSIKDFISIRTQSIRGQLNGTIPATTSEQEKHVNLLVDASKYYCPDGSLVNGISLSNLGSIGIEDLLRLFNDQTSVYAVLKIVHFDWKDIGIILSRLNAMQSQETAAIETSASGNEIPEVASLISIHDEEEFSRQCFRLIWLTLRGVIVPFVAFITLIISIIVLRRTDKNLRPRARWRKNGANSH